MERKVTQIQLQKQSLPKPVRVAAYARVSSEKDAMYHSLSAQINYYSKLIQSHNGLQYAGVYSDEAKSGTKDTRENFVRLISDCREGKIDRIITKSVSRFARNTVTLLNTTRELKELGIDVFFEEQNIHTLSGDGELMLSILASFAQAESQSASENQKWRIKKNFEEGKPWSYTMYGYRNENGRLTIVPNEAETVKLIYNLYLSGKGVVAIMKILNKKAIPSKHNKAWCQSSVKSVLKNYAYTGNLLLQTTMRENYITKKKILNNGELPKYRATDTHEAIIPLETYTAVQTEIARRAPLHIHKQAKSKYPFTGLITCGICGKHYRRKITATGIVWICPTYNTLEKARCPSKQIPENALISAIADNGIDISQIKAITAEKDNGLSICLIDGKQAEIRFKDRSRAESWTEEKKAEARKKYLERSNRNG